MCTDAGALASSGYQKTSGLLSLLQGFKSEPDFVVWDEILARIGALRAAWTFEDQKVKDALKKVQRDLVGEKAHQIGWTFKDSDGHVEQQFKSLLFGNAGLAGDEEVCGAAAEMFEKFKAGDRSAIHPNLRSSVFSIMLSRGGKSEVSPLQNVLFFLEDFK